MSGYDAWSPGDDLVPVYPERYEMRIGPQGERLLLNSVGDSILPNTESMRDFLERIRGKFFVSIRTSLDNQLVRSGQNPIYRNKDDVEKIGTGRFAEALEKVEEISLCPFVVADVMHQVENESERIVVFPWSDSKTVSWDKLFLIRPERRLTWGSDKHFLYVGDAAQEFLGKIFAFGSKWGLTHELILQLLSVAGQQDVLFENKAAQKRIAERISRLTDGIAELTERINALEDQIGHLRSRRDLHSDFLELFSKFSKK